MRRPISNTTGCGSRASVRVRATPRTRCEVTLTGETKPSHDGTMDFLDNRLDVSTGTLRSRAVIPNKDLSILPGQFGRVRLIGERALRGVAGA